MKRLWRTIAGLAIVVIVAVVIVPFLSTRVLNESKPGGQPEEGRHGHRGGGGKDAPTPVLTAKSEQADVPVYVEGVGTGQAWNSVLIRSQVDGVLTSLHFSEGQDVKAGALIATIDPRLYQATLDQNVAKKALDEANLANARVDLDRYKQLVATKAATQQQYATQQATVNEDIAQVNIDQALIDSARTTLSYTNITTPIAGRTGIRNVDVGNLIHATDTTGIVTVSEVQPIAVIFNVPQQELPRINKASLLNQLDVQALNPLATEPIDHGKLTVVNNTIDATTGTVKLKAEFANPDLQLWPGIFVNVRLKVETLTNAITIPVAALQQGPKGPFVFTVTPDNKAKMVSVKIGQQDDTKAVITAGLTANETVITSGFQKLQSGGVVQPAEDTQAEADEKRPGLHHGGLTPVAPDAAAPDAVPGETPAPRHRHGDRRSSAAE